MPATTAPDTSSGPVFSVLMVCTGNICRSPTADGLLRHRLREAGLDNLVLVDSAGTHDYHVGRPPDRRSTAKARSYGVDLSSLRARQVRTEDFARFDLILAMDTSHHDILLQICPPQYRERVKLYLDYAPQFGREVPDPYYGAEDGFETVWRMCDAVSAALLDEIRRRLG
ncbi:low molecular weight protein-tyrosine-phosphatase [Ferrovibrio sp.]|uniref:low molecular weight protein-tyrosine-phosphatase n=1 Tax=Ferrovibrio sp. TaxID=1917215 RepID=UPI002619C939|nr:low molecular weight protein-tyrosine-phosphatase [Ferrovibrio sp.]